MKKILIAIVVLAVLTWGALKYWRHTDVSGTDAVTVKTSAVTEVLLPLEVKAIGTVVAKSIEITPEVAGHVDKVLFQDGTFIEAGTALIQLDDAVFKAKLASAKAKWVYSQNDYKRKALLGKQGAIAKQAIDQAEADFKEKEAEMQESDVMLNKMKLTAPFAGMVGQGRVNPGDYVTVGQGMVALTDTKHLRIEYNVPEKYLAAVKLGQSVKMIAAAYPGKEFMGKVSFISPTINTNNRSIALYAELPNPDNLLAAGMFVDVIQSLGTQAKTVMIPARSLVPALDNEQVYLLVDGHAKLNSVSVGKRMGDKVEILKGVSSGDTVITDGQLKLRNGMQVRVAV
ncbi:MAG: efflux RND transporter periplasmic adaptor subunit [Gammaproteobacteria bacterium]